MVVDGETGFLVDEPADWARAIEVLARRPALRKAMGAAGRRRARQYFDTSRWAPQFAWFVHQAWCRVEGRPSAATPPGFVPTIDLCTLAATGV